MDGDIVDRMRAEEAELIKKLEAVRAFLAAYGGAASPAPASKPANRVSRTGAREKVEIDGYGGYGRKVVAEAMRMLMASSHPIKTSDLIGPIEAMGVEITGQNKVNALGALLSRSIDIVSHGKAGWSLASREKAARIVAEHGSAPRGVPAHDPIDEILGESVAQKENEPLSGSAGGSDTREFGAPPPPRDFGNPHSWPSS